jgi:EAL domain-containing protein (putative c-di-GMP-specific phosphodiesterase class I)/DICT domain-containing protein
MQYVDEHTRTTHAVPATTTISARSTPAAGNATPTTLEASPARCIPADHPRTDLHPLSGISGSHDSEGLQLSVAVAAVTDLLDGGTVQPVFQPIVDLTSGCTVAYEALARGPHGHHLESPDALFAAARAAGMLTALDVTCLDAAAEAARASDLTAPWTLFVNVEPDSYSNGILPALASTSTLPVVVELTERALTDDPAHVLGTVALIRQAGWGVALDDVGVNPDSLALLPLIAPDVIKLDAALVQRPPDQHTARVFSAVAAEVERTGCIVLAEGIETAEHLHAAHALGAHLGQGWLFHPPGQLPAAFTDPPDAPLELRALGPSHSDLTPFGAVAQAREVRTAGKALLLAMSKHLERQAAAIGESCLVLTTFQTAAAFAPAQRRYSALARGNAYVAVFGSGIADQPAPGVRGIDLDPEEPLSLEWNLVIVGPHFAAVLAARLNDPATDPDPGWDYVLSHDRDLAVRAATTLMNRITRAERPASRRCDPCCQSPQQAS